MKATGMRERKKMRGATNWNGRKLGMLFILLAIGIPALAEGEDTPPETVFPDANRIVAIGDLHGDFDAAQRAFRLAGATDDEDRWIGQDLVVVQTGDLLDRGDEEQAIIDLLYRLRDEAARAGGALHLLNGNHELMNVDLDLRYVTDGGYADFEDAVAIDSLDRSLSEYEDSERARVFAFRPGGPYAQILSTGNLVVVVGETVFVHGGILPEHVDYGLEQLNLETREWLRGERERPEWSRGGSSPVWSRHFSDEVGEDDCELLESVLEALDADRIVVGHSVQDDGITSYCDERVWCIDVGMAEAYGGPIQVLEIRGEEIRILREPTASEPAPE